VTGGPAVLVLRLTPQNWCLVNPCYTMRTVTSDQQITKKPFAELWESRNTVAQRMVWAIWVVLDQVYGRIGTLAREVSRVDFLLH
jgi:hypothetical protein